MLLYKYNVKCFQQLGEPTKSALQGLSAIAHFFFYCLCHPRGIKSFIDILMKSAFLLSKGIFTGATNISHLQLEFEAVLK